MILLLALVLVVLIAVAARVSVPSLRRWRMAAELRGDWWSRFEQQLRDYERGGGVTARERGK